MEAQEFWKDVAGYEEVYQISSLGRVRSKDHYVKTGRYNGTRLAPGKLLKPNKSSHGYLFIKTSKKYGSKHLAIHRLVAQAFISNPNNYPDVNHKDEVKDNNRLENLEWCNHSYNAKYGTCQQRLLKYKQKAVCMIDLKTNQVLKTFISMKVAAREIGVSSVCISCACRGKSHTAGGYGWRYANGN